MATITIGHHSVKARIMALTLVLAASFRLCTAQENAPPAAPVDDPVARSIVEKADLVRFPAEGFQVDINITTSQQGQNPELRKYRVLSYRCPRFRRPNPASPSL